MAHKQPDQSQSFDAAEWCSTWLKGLAQWRERVGLTQRGLAERMASTQRIVSKLEHGGDVNITTLARYLAAVGFELAIRPIGSHQIKCAPVRTAPAPRRHGRVAKRTVVRRAASRQSAASARDRILAELQRVPVGQRTFLAELRTRLGGCSRVEVDRELLALEREGLLVLLSADNPRERTAEREAAGVGVGGETRHLFYRVH